MDGASTAGQRVASEGTMAKKKNRGRDHRSHRRAANRAMPHVAVATICERVLREGQTPTLIRLIDTFNIASDSEEMPPGVLSFVVFVMLKSGPARGDRRIRITGKAPSGQIVLDEEREVNFAGEEAGAVIEANVNLAVRETGLYWFDVSVGSEIASRIPMKIHYARRAAAQ
jgi:hypothetical protein